MISVWGTDITREMCSGAHISQGNTYHCNTVTSLDKLSTSSCCLARQQVGQRKSASLAISSWYCSTVMLAQKQCINHLQAPSQKRASSLPGVTAWQQTPQTLLLSFSRLRVLLWVLLPFFGIFCRPLEFLAAVVSTAVA